MKALRLIIAFVTMLVLMLPSVIGGSTLAAQAVSNPAPAHKQVPADAMNFTVEMLPAKKGSSPSDCRVEWTQYIMPWEWPSANVICLSGAGRYQIKVTFKNAFTRISYSRKGPIVKVGKRSKVSAYGPFDWVTNARWKEA